MKLKSVFFILLSVFLLTGCEDNEEVGAIIQPSGDRLTTNSNMVDVLTSTVLSNAVLSKYDDLILGEYTDSKFGTIQAEFMSQIDARIKGLRIPETNVVSPSSSTLGIRSDLLKNFDSKYGDIKSITSTRNLTVDSVVYLIQYGNDFFGDSTALQAVNIYALNKTLNSDSEKYFTNTEIAEFSKKDTLLGYAPYQIQNSRQIRVPLDIEFGKRLAKVYQGETAITTQAQFNDFFKGVYVSHSFNQGGIIKVEVSGILLYYSYEADIQTTYEGKDTIIDSKELKNPDGSRFNPLVSSIFLSANNAVDRVILINRQSDEDFTSLLEETDVTYTYTPTGLYTNVQIPFSAMIDSIKAKQENEEVDVDFSKKVFFNSAKLKIYTKELNWDTKLKKTPNSHILLIPRDSIVPFFYENRIPDEKYSFLGNYNETTKSYTFDLTKALQKKLADEVVLSENMVLVPIVVNQTDNIYYYTQELWITATMLHGKNSPDVEKRPRIDMIYTQRK
jgi:hypothetical protein